MKCSELIQHLKDVITVHGDLNVVVGDGMDPSDWCDLRSGEILNGAYMLPGTHLALSCSSPHGRDVAWTTQDENT